MNALIALEDGRTFTCRSFTGDGEAGGEVVFNTGMTGYQEILTDPSYTGQLVTMAYPLIGNYGVNQEDVESAHVQVAAFLIKEYQPWPSNFRSTGTLADYLKAENVLGLEGLDTRALTRHIRKAGAMRAMASTRDLDPGSLVQRARALPSMAGQDLATPVSTTRAYRLKENRPDYLPDDWERLGNRIWHTALPRPRVVAFDFGIKYNILRSLEAVGLDVLVVPAATSADAVKRLAPDGIFLSNGPGDPEPLTGVIATIRELIDFRPIFGICLGHQLLGLALGGTSYKLKFGHRGINQPVKELSSGRVSITSQNHGFAIRPESLDTRLIEITHINLNDQTLEGFRHRTKPIFSVQYHPEAAPGPNDAKALFTSFARLLNDTPAPMPAP